MIKPVYAGLMTVAHLDTETHDDELVDRLANYLVQSPQTGLFDIAVRQVHVIDATYFHNIHIGNFRNWDQVPADDRFPTGKARGRGVEITGDYNDRYAYNERASYRTNRGTASGMIDAGLDAIALIVEKIKESIK